MPWKEKTVEQSRTEFVSEVLSKEKSLSRLCIEYGITRTTGYKWLRRAGSGEALSDRPRGCPSHPGKTSAEVEELILEERGRHPAWGARKLKRRLEDRGYKGLPAQSTICEILKRNGMVTPEESAAHIPYTRFEKEHPNDMWQTDFKGDFGLLDSSRCHPLTVLDDCSRFAICLEAKANEQAQGVFDSFRRIFLEYGLPGSILCDNGPPWGDSKPGAITLFDVWMMHLGILPIHIRPRRPQTQGKDERFHLTLKREVLARELFQDISQAQHRFDIWRDEYNNERPHEAIGLDVPSKRYRKSKREMPSTVREPEYDEGRDVRKVNYKGYISIRGHRYYLTEALAEKLIELRPVSQTHVGLYYGGFRVALIDLNEQVFTSRRIYRTQP
jgi:transposase InsO family protein